MINACLKKLKASLMLGIRKVGSSVASISEECIKISNLLFFDFLEIDEFLTVSLALPPTPTTSLLSALNAFRIKFDDLVVFNIEVSSAAILLKP